MRTPLAPRARRLAGALSLSLLGALAAAAPALAGDEAPPSRTFVFAYEAKVPAAPQGTKRLQAWIPLPVEDDIQKVADLRASATLAGQEVLVQSTRDEASGNRFAYVVADDPRGELVLRWTATITRAEDRGQGTGAVQPRDLAANRLLPVTGRAAELAQRLGVDQAGDANARSRVIYDEVLKSMVYDKQAPGWGKGDFERACDVGKGNCTDFHAKFLGIARAAGIPARFTMGIPITPEASGTAAGYHCWAHFHNGTTWVPVDISEAQKVLEKDPEKARWFYGHLDADRVALTIGRDVDYAPRQQGETPLFIVYPYAEADGKALEIPKENRSFTWTPKP